MTPVLLVLLWSGMFVGDALATSRFVSWTGIDDGACAASSTPCRSIAAALAAASSGDEIDIASGTYVENLRIDGSTTLTLLDWWDASFATRNPIGAPSTVKGGRVTTATYSGPDRVLSVSAVDGETFDVTVTDSCSATAAPQRTFRGWKSKKPEPYWLRPQRAVALPRRRLKTALSRSRSAM